MPANRDLLDEKQRGDPLLASDWNLLVQHVRRPFNLPDSTEDSVGVIQFRRPQGSTPEAAEVHFEMHTMFPNPLGTATAFPRTRDMDTGLFVTDCDAEEVVVVDCMGMGFAGAVGAIGWGIEVTLNDGSTIVDVRDMQCRPFTTNTCGGGPG